MESMPANAMQVAEITVTICYIPNLPVEHPGCVFILRTLNDASALHAYIPSQVFVGGQVLDLSLD
jgi:hypothetical protein